jgi:hypothetical protein
MPGPFATPKTWFCAGCNRTHSISRDIEGDDGCAGYWCAHSIREGIKRRRNDLPPQADYFRREMERNAAARRKR